MAETFEQDEFPTLSIRSGVLGAVERKVNPMAPVYFIDIFGWIGSVAVIVAYALISSSKVNSRSRLYQVLNLLGSLCLIVNTAYYHAFPSTVVNFVWLVIAASTLARIVRSADEETTQPQT